MPPVLVIEPVPSRLWLALCGCGLLAVLVLLPLTRAPWGLQAVLAILVTWAAWRSVRADGWLGGAPPGPICCGGEGWRLRGPARGDWQPVTLRSDFLVWPHLVILRFERADGGVHSQALWRDSVSPAQHRRLRALLRWLPGPRATA